MSPDLGLRRSWEVNGCSYATWSAGQGSPLILLHGWPVTSRHWRGIVPDLLAAGYQTHCIDLRALGESFAVDGDFSKENLALETIEVISRLLGESAPFTVVGHDWGGSVGIAIAAICDRVKNLVVEEEVPPGIHAQIAEPGASRYPSWHGAFHRENPLADQLISSHRRAYFDFFLRLRMNPDGLPSDDRESFLAAYDDERRLSAFLAYYRTRTEDLAFFQGLVHSKIAVPVLGLGGKYGMNTAVWDALEQIAVCPSFKLLDESGHYPAQEQPQQFVENVLAFLRKE
jgi:pimeloyl-ACP methyl ester carboxylesterase